MEEKIIAALMLAKANQVGTPLSRRWIYVSTSVQKLWLFEGEYCVKAYTCSTSKRPPSNQYGSLGTPLGLHRIAEKIGEGEKAGTVFEKRESLGRTYTEEEATAESKALVTTRIMWLDGMEPGKNNGYECGSHNRKIYIHGTNHAEKVGQPKSLGCVELTDEDTIELFETVSANDLVLID